MARGSWLVARGSWFVARGSWFVARGSWLVARGSWLVVRGSWPVARGSWFVARGSWFVGAVLKGGPALLLGELSAQLTERLIGDLRHQVAGFPQTGRQPQLSVLATVLHLPLVGT